MEGGDRQWWTEQEQAFGLQPAQATFARPAVTTGATQWAGQKRAAGPVSAPRAIQTSPCTLPIITLSAGTAHTAKLTLPCQLEFPAYAPAPKPQQQQAKRAELDTAESPLAARSDSSGSDACVQEPSPHLAPAPAALCSTPQPAAAPPVVQTVTTAQNFRGLPQGEPSHAFPSHELLSACEAGAQWHAPQRSASVTTGHQWHARQPSAGESSGNASARRAGLRSGSKRRPEPVGEQEQPPEAAADAAAAAAFGSPVTGGSDRRVRRRESGSESTATTRSADEELLVLGDKVASLEAAQARLLEHCAAAQGSVRSLQEQLLNARGRWMQARSENLALHAELEFFRANATMLGLDATKGLAWPEADASLAAGHRPLGGALMPTEAEIAADLAAEDALLCQPRW